MKCMNKQDFTTLEKAAMLHCFVLMAMVNGDMVEGAKEEFCSISKELECTELVHEMAKLMECNAAFQVISEMDMEKKGIFAHRLSHFMDLNNVSEMAYSLWCQISSKCKFPFYSLRKNISYENR